jgi:beta-barrel assembly-enhancing protease
MELRQRWTRAAILPVGLAFLTGCAALGLGGVNLISVEQEWELGREIERELAAELAAVLAHEVGHGVARHGTRRLSQQYGVAILAGLVLGENPALLAEIAASIAAAGAMARSSRDDELEADELGLRFTANAGYHPEGMVTFLERLLEMREREPGRVAGIFASHPAPEERIERARSTIAGMGSLGHLTVQDDRFPGVRSRVR